MTIFEKLKSEEFLREAGAIVALLASLFSLLALATYDPADLGANAAPANPVVGNVGGTMGAHLALGLFNLFGLSAYLLVGLFLVWSTVYFLRKDVSDLAIKFVGIAMLVIATSILFSLRTDAENFMWADRTPSYGGLLGDAAASWLRMRFGSAGVYLLVLAVMAVSFILATDLFFYSLLSSGWTRMRTWIPTLFPRRARLAPVSENTLSMGLGGTGVGLKIPAWLHHQTIIPPERAEPMAFTAAAAPSAAVTSTKASAPHSSAQSVASATAVATPPPQRGLLKEQIDGLRKIVQQKRQLSADLARAEEEARTAFDRAEAERHKREAVEASLKANKQKAPSGKQEASAAATAVASKPALSLATGATGAASPTARRSAVATRPPPVAPSAQKKKKLATGAANGSKTAPASATPAKSKGKSAPPRSEDEAELPPSSLLDVPTVPDNRGVDDAMREKAATLIDTLKTFKIECELANIDRGPVITMFELALAPGIKVQRVAGLADNIAMALMAPSVRIVAPIPGKSTVGVEVPNLERVPVRLREIVESEAFRDERLAIPMILGKEATGKPLVTDLARMPHLLIAGQTGAGKSVCINSLLLSILFSRQPSEVRLLLVDPKQVELSFYADVPHLMLPVVTDMKAAARILDWAVQEMESRYELLSKLGMRSLTSFNKHTPAELRDMLLEKGESAEYIQRWARRMPYIVIVIDELADLMMVAAKEVEAQITRLAQKSRAIGIHLILATQRPSVDVITGLIKANVPCRISFQVACKIDSRTILDGPGAEKLLGRGDMLYRAPGSSFLHRAQGAFVDDAEVIRVVEFLQENAAPPEFDAELSAIAEPESDRGGEGVEYSQRDGLYDKAVRIILETQRGSVSLLQRKLQIGYTRAAKLVDFMQEDGIVGAPNGSKAREIKMTLEEWEARVAGKSAVALVEQAFTGDDVDDDIVDDDDDDDEDDEFEDDELDDEDEFEDDEFEDDDDDEFEDDDDDEEDEEEDDDDF